ncbi:hypothetical protein C7379_10471 [Hallella colorans]|uniref:Uncharacterized protein n=1 Tax=Hallella colorans TaxID=1703337 RepID=A0A2U0UII0_9BACT|nr:hypothetical protein C7379_10471 [Hallella colorans]
MATTLISTQLLIALAFILIGARVGGVGMVRPKACTRPPALTRWQSRKNTARSSTARARWPIAVPMAANWASRTEQKLSKPHALTRIRR